MWLEAQFNGMLTYSEVKKRLKKSGRLGPHQMSPVERDRLKEVLVEWRDGVVYSTVSNAT